MATTTGCANLYPRAGGGLPVRAAPHGTWLGRRHPAHRRWTPPTPPPPRAPRAVPTTSEGHRMYRRLLITGSQLWTETTMIRDALAQVWHPDTIMMSGACPRGADTLCESCWTHSGGRVDRYPAQWYQGGRFRRDAGFRRNTEMVQ